MYYSVSTDCNSVEQAYNYNMKVSNTSLDLCPICSFNLVFNLSLYKGEHFSGCSYAYINMYIIVLSWEVCSSHQQLMESWKGF